MERVYQNSQAIAVFPNIDYQKAEEFRNLILNAKNCSEKNILHLLNANADKIRNTLHIELRVGAQDVLYCDNEIVHLHLMHLSIPHRYIQIEGTGHDLGKIV